MILKCKHQIQVYSLKPYWFQIKILPLLTLKWHILIDDHSYTMQLEDTRIWTFQTFSLFLESLVKTKKKCHFLLTPVVPKRQNKLLLISRRSQKSAVFHFFKHLRKTTILEQIFWCFLNFQMTKISFNWKKKEYTCSFDKNDE